VPLIQKNQVAVFLGLGLGGFPELQADVPTFFGVGHDGVWLPFRGLYDRVGRYSPHGLDLQCVSQAASLAVGHSP